uniref:Uncharacterized protein n=1 Tax=Panagrolaimus sp. PS1159 TaxID=55785 RepID=A0AC35FUR2_9BILA
MKQPIKVIDKLNGQTLAEYTGHSNEEFQIECGILPSKDEVVSGSEDGFVYIYDFVGMNIISKLDHSPAKFIHSITIHPKKPILITSARDRVFVWGSPDSV